MRAFAARSRGGVGQHLLRALGGAMAWGSLPTTAAGFDICGWTGELSELTRALATGRIRPRQWQEGVDRLYARVNVPTLLAQIDFDTLRGQLVLEDGVGEKFRKAHLPGKRGVVTKVAALAKGASIPPHGHHNMVSAFLVLSGGFHLRLYERLAVHADAYSLRRTADRCMAGGEWTSSSEERDNVHWLTATRDETFLFSAKRIRLAPDAMYKGRQYVDPSGVGSDAGSSVAPFLERERAYALFG